MSGRIAGGKIVSYNPATGAELGRVRMALEEDYDEAVWQAAQTFERWRMLPAPQRGEMVRENCGAPRMSWGNWSRSNRERFLPKAWAKFRR
jgi:hypothetical protein